MARRRQYNPVNHDMLDIASGFPLQNNPMVNELDSFELPRISQRHNVLDQDYWGTNQSSPPTPPSTATGIKDWFSKVKSAPILSNTGWNLTGNSKLGLGNTGGNAGLTIAGHNLGGLATAGAGIYQGIKGLQNLSNLNSANTEKSDILNQIRASVASNPMISSYLSSDQQKLLNQIKRGKFDTNNIENDNAFLDSLKGAGMGALTGLAGGLPGMIVGGIGGGLNGAMQSQANAQQGQNSQLEALYQALADAEDNYRSMRIPNYVGLGLQSRYTNNWR